VDNLRFGWIQNETPGGAFTVNPSNLSLVTLKILKTSNDAQFFFILNLEFGGDALIFVITVL